ELAVGRDVIGTDTDQPRAGLLVVRERVAKGTGLLGAAWSVVLGVEVENQRWTFQLGKGHLLTLLIEQCEVGGGLASFHHDCGPLDRGKVRHRGWSLNLHGSLSIRVPR